MNEAERNPSDRRPGWVRARDENRELNAHQRIAEGTHGVVRLPNLMTATGVGLTIFSAIKARQGKPITALATGAAGYMLDMEGSVGRALGVEDPKWGARTDRAADGVKAAITAATLLETGVLPKEAAALAYGPKALGVGAWGVAKLNSHEELQSSRFGKLAEWPRDIMPLGFLLASAGRKFSVPNLVRAGNIIGWTAAGAAAALGSVATAGYYLEALSDQRDA